VKDGYRGRKVTSPSSSKRNPLRGTRRSGTAKLKGASEYRSEEREVLEEKGGIEKACGEIELARICGQVQGR